MKKLLLLALIGLILAGCILPSNTGIKADYYPKLGEQFVLKLNQSAYIQPENLLITFSRLPLDSRCPTGVQCIWAGNVNVSLELRKPASGGGAGQISEISIVKDTSEQPSVQVFKDYDGNQYAVKLVQVNPYPKYNESREQRDYSVMLIITKN